VACILGTTELVQRLRGLRKAAGLSAQDIADITGIPRSILANLENGRRAQISVDEVAAICEALGVDLRVVLSDEPMPVARTVWVV
jgi:transcriptional regulator with XRE-family HTH domain